MKSSRLLNIAATLAASVIVSYTSLAQDNSFNQAEWKNIVLSKLPEYSGIHSEISKLEAENVRLRKDMDSVKAITDITIKKQVKQKAEGFVNRLDAPNDHQYGLDMEFMHRRHLDASDFSEITDASYIFTDSDSRLVAVKDYRAGNFGDMNWGVENDVFELMTGKIRPGLVKIFQDPDSLQSLKDRIKGGDLEHTLKRYISQGVVFADHSVYGDSVHVMKSDGITSIALTTQNQKELNNRFGLSLAYLSELMSRLSETKNSLTRKNTALKKSMEDAVVKKRFKESLFYAAYLDSVRKSQARIVAAAAGLPESINVTYEKNMPIAEVKEFSQLKRWVEATDSKSLERLQRFYNFQNFTWKDIPLENLSDMLKRKGGVCWQFAFLDMMALGTGDYCEFWYKQGSDNLKGHAVMLFKHNSEWYAGDNNQFYSTGISVDSDESSKQAAMRVISKHTPLDRLKQPVYLIPYNSIIGRVSMNSGTNNIYSQIERINREGKNEFRTK